MYNIYNLFPVIVIVVDELLQNQDFKYQYDDLLSIRLKFQRSYKKYENSLEQYYQYLTQYADLLQQISDFREKYCQVSSSRFLMNRFLFTFLSPILHSSCWRSFINTFSSESTHWRYDSRKLSCEGDPVRSVVPWSSLTDAISSFTKEYLTVVINWMINCRKEIGSYIVINQTKPFDNLFILRFMYCWRFQFSFDVLCNRYWKTAIGQSNVLL